MIRNFIAMLMEPFIPEGYEIGFMMVFLPRTITFGITLHWGNCTCPFCGGMNGLIVNLFSWSFSMYWRKSWQDLN